MLKRISVTIFTLLILYSGAKAQNMKEDIKKYIESIESIEDARDKLDEQIKAIDFIESMHSLQSLKLMSADEDEEDSNEDEDYKPAISIPTHINGDSIKAKLANYFQKISFAQNLTPPSSEFRSGYDASDLALIFGIPLSNPDALINLTAHKIYYADGTIESPEKELFLKQYQEFDHARFIDSMQVKMVLHYPTAVQKISLSAEHTSVEDSTIQMTSIQNREASLTLSEKVYNNLIVIQGIDNNGKTLDHTSKSTSSNYSPSTSIYFQEVAKESQVIIDNIDNNKYASFDDLKKDMLERLSSIEAPEESQHYTAWVQFKRKIKGVDIYYTTQQDSIEISETIVNRDLSRSSKKGFHVASDPETYKYGVVDNTGNWIIEPQFVWLKHFNDLFFEGEKDEDDQDYKTYKLNIENRILAPYKYQIADTISGKYYVVYEGESSDKTGLMDRDERIIIPLEKYSIYSPLKNLFIVKASNGETIKTGLYNELGKVILPEIYYPINVGEDGYIYASIYDNERLLTTIFDTDIKQITKDKWSAQNQFTPHSDLVLIEDENGSKFYINKQAEIVIPQSNDYKFDNEFWFGMTVVEQKDPETEEYKYGYIDTKGKLTIPIEYDKALPFQGEYAYVEKDGKAMLIDKNNNIYKALPLIIGSWGYVLDIDPVYTQYRLEDDSVLDGYGNFVKNM